MTSSPRPLWGWSTPVRALLTVVAAVLALGLGWASRTGSEGRAPGPAPELVVDPNTAPPGVLLALPRLGPALVGRIITARRGVPFRSLDDLDDRVRGIGPVTIAALRPHLRIEPSSDAPTDRLTPPRPARSRPRRR